MLMKQFYIDSDNGYAVLLGYIMPLTKTEFSILNRVARAEEYISAEAIQAEILDGRNITLGNIAVHICNINKKAKRISGRDLIKTRRYKGYKISEVI